MAQALDLLQPLVPGLVAVPAAQPGICPVCRTAVKDNFDCCFLCAGEQMRIVPISLSVHSGMLHHHLRNYKDGREAVRGPLTLRLAALLEVYLQNHLESCLGGPIDLVATVPSAKRDAPWSIVQRLQRFSNQPVNPLRWAVDADGGGAVAADASVGGQQVLLLDDTFTAGTSIFNAHRVLVAAGAEVVGPLVLGRHVRPDFSPSVAMLECARATTWDPMRCAICAGVICHPPLRQSPSDPPSLFS